MTAETKNELGYIITGTASAVGIGSLLFQAVGALILGLMGAAGSYLFVRFIKPKLDKLFKK